MNHTETSNKPKNLPVRHLLRLSDGKFHNIAAIFNKDCCKPTIFIDVKQQSPDLKS